MGDEFRKEFSAREYEPVAGALVGLRLFGVTDEGRLTGVSYRTEWAPGANTTECHTASGAWGRLFAQIKTENPYLANLIATHHSVTAHAVLDDPVCGCGFWAYTAWEGKTTLMTGAGLSVIGVVEGWGRMVIGPRGFRAEKARIVALAFPASTSPETAALVTTTATELDYVMRALDRAALRETAEKPPVELPWVASHTYAARVAQQYPDAAIYPDEPSMLAEFPLSDLSGLLEDAS